MSWSRTYGGRAKDVIAAFSDDHPKLMADVPELEQPQVTGLLAAAKAMVQELPEGADVSLYVAGHAFNNHLQIRGGGGCQISLSYSVGPVAAVSKPPSVIKATDTLTLHKTAG